VTAEQGRPGDHGDRATNGPGEHHHAVPAPGHPGPVPARVRRQLTAAVLPLAVATVIGLVVLWPRSDLPSRPSNLGAPVDLETATVTAVREGPCGGSAAITGDTSGVPAPNTCLTADIRVSSGPEKGSATSLEVGVGPGNPPLKRGDRIVVGRTSDPGLGTIYYFSDYQRQVPLLLLAVLFAAVVVGVGRLRGLTSLLGLIVTFCLLLKFVLPAVLEGRSPLAVAIVGSAAAMFVILYLSHGVNALTTTALLGTLASLGIIGVLAALFVELANIVNLGTEEATFLQVSAGQVNLQGLLLGGVIIGSLGVLNDVTVTQASAVWALRSANPTWGVARLYRSAIGIGRDHIASVVDTLVLAYAGASLPLLLLFTLAGRPVGQVLTGELVAEEIVRSLVGSIGLVASVPITTALAALVASQARRRPSRPSRPSRPRRRKPGQPSGPSQ
jgi:uncharacterized membrane protein